MTRPIALLAASLPVLALGLVAQAFDPYAIVSHAVEAQAALWQRLGAPPSVRPGWAPAAEMLWTTAMGAAMIWLILRARLYWACVFALGALVAGFYAALLLAKLKGMTLDVIAPDVILFLTFAAGASLRWVQVRAMKQQLRFAFSDSLPRGALEKIARDPSLLSLDGETRTVTYLVCGIRGLTELASTFNDRPRAFTQMMEQVLTPLMSQILRHGGVIGRLTADGFTAYWNAPLDDPRHALHACDAANGMVTALARTNERFQPPASGPAPKVEIGIGIATGSVVAGGFGGQGRLSYTINGDAVRLAARLQALSRNYGPTVIVSEETREAATKDFAFLEVDYIAQGKDDQPVRLYAMLENPMARSSPKIRALVTFHEHIFQSLRAQQWAKARGLVEQCRNLSGACQSLYDLYMARIGFFESNPPGPDWDGAFRPVLK
ncbi:MAG TPA: adenylate/guanylate cyclase domain-containing protein [Rhizomicrobium sp.]